MALKVDAAAPYDPLVFCIGFFVVGTGLIITQSIRDEGVFLKARIGPPFNLLRKTAGLTLLMQVIMGFWIVGAWWLFLLPLLSLLSGMAFKKLETNKNRVGLSMTLIIVGLQLVFWAQAPKLRALGDLLNI